MKSQESMDTTYKFNKRTKNEVSASKQASPTNILSVSSRKVNRKLQKPP